MSLHTTGLPVGDAITVWWVVFNHPGNCTHGALGLRCGEGDLFESSVDASVLYAAGHVIGGSGVADYGGHLSVGDTSGALFGPGLTNPRGADIHLIVHDHGPAIPDLVSQQIHSFGVCNPVCLDLQASAHEQCQPLTHAAPGAGACNGRPAPGISSRTIREATGAASPACMQMVLSAHLDATSGS